MSKRKAVKPAEPVLQPEPVDAEGSAGPLPETQPIAIEPEPELVAPVESAPEPALPAGSYVLAVEGWPASSPEAWALEFARKLKRPVTIRDGATLAVLRQVEPVSKADLRAAARAARAPRAPRSPRLVKSEPEGMIAAMIALAVRRDGVTRPELSAEVSAKQQPWTTLLIKAAARWGYAYSTEKRGKLTAYYLRRIEVDAAA